MAESQPGPDETTAMGSACSAYFRSVWIPGEFKTVALGMFVLVTVTSFSSNNSVTLLVGLHRIHKNYTQESL